MSPQALRARAAHLFPNNLYYQESWIRMINFLGDRWLLATKVSRGNNQ